MPWQQHVADVATEIDPDTGRLLTRVPSDGSAPVGKSTFSAREGRASCSATEFFGPRQRLVYTAQTRQKAREKFEEDYYPDIEQSRAGCEVDLAGQRQRAPPVP
jgi:hypothetical protein